MCYAFLLVIGCVSGAPSLSGNSHSTDQQVFFMEDVITGNDIPATVTLKPVSLNISLTNTSGVAEHALNATTTISPPKAMNLPSVPTTTSSPPLLQSNLSSVHHADEPTTTSSPLMQSLKSLVSVATIRHAAEESLSTLSPVLLSNFSTVVPHAANLPSTTSSPVQRSNLSSPSAKNLSVSTVRTTSNSTTSSVGGFFGFLSDFFSRVFHVPIGQSTARRTSTTSSTGSTRNQNWTVFLIHLCYNINYQSYMYRYILEFEHANF